MPRQQRPRPPALQDFKELRQLVEVQGPFISTAVLRNVFPQGFPSEDSLLADLNGLRLAYDAWLAAPAFDLAAHDTWVRFVIFAALEFEAVNVLSGQDIPQSVRFAISPNLLIAAAPEEDLLGGETSPAQPLFPIFFRGKGEELDALLDGAVVYLHQTTFPIALVTNGEQWAIVHAPPDGVTSVAVWYAEMWWEERLTFRAFRALLGARRWFNVAATETLPALLKRSEDNQGAITKQLGRQVRQAVELLILSLDRADQDKNRGLLADIPVQTLYEAALSVMMRLIFLFFAEERELLPANDDLYAEAYAVSTIREQLQAQADRFGAEVLERRHDAWSRLLATFRAVHAGLGHDRLTLPAYGGQLFDPDRFPFLEGRQAGSTWREMNAVPLPVDNRTVLYALNALQTLQEGGESRGISFRELDVPDIGHVYESLLDHTAKRAGSVTLGLIGKEGEEAEVPLVRVEEWRTAVSERLIEDLGRAIGKSGATLAKLLEKEVDTRLRDRLRTACRGDEALLARLLPLAHLIRPDQWGHPVVILPGSVFVTEGKDRRSTGTHYTPTSLTEPIVQYTLEPVVYMGPAEGLPREQWTLKSPSKLLQLKVCDMACGSGAFLVAAARYLSARLQEAWAVAGAFQPGSPRRSPDGLVSQGGPEEDLIPLEPEAREAYALRAVAQRCLYGVDVNPLAAEMCKLSLWLLTLAKGKPFTFLDHAIKSGDSLIGVSLQQLDAFHLDDLQQLHLNFGQTLDEITDKRRTLAMVRAETVRDVDRQARLLADAEGKTQALRWIGDALIGMELKGAESPKDVGTELCLELQSRNFEAIRSLTEQYRNGVSPFHWALEFPEVFEDGGFHAIVGNPPFIGGQKITGVLGRPYREFLVKRLANEQRGSADYSAYFFLRARMILAKSGCFGLLATNTIAQGDTREVGMDQLISDSTIMRAIPSRKWPGEANLEVAYVWMRKGSWPGPFVLDGLDTHGINPSLTAPGLTIGNPYRLQANEGKSFQGSNVLGMGFFLEPKQAHELITKDPRNADVLFPYVNGEDLNSRPDQTASRWVINFRDWPLEKAGTYPDCINILREKVKPERDLNNRKVRRERWWQFAERASELYATIANLERVLALSLVNNHLALAFVPQAQVFAHKLCVIASQTEDDFAVLQSHFHYHWAWQYSSTMRLDINYSPSDCLLTFPFPAPIPALEVEGTRFDSARNQIMRNRAIGLTKLYNLFHDQTCRDLDICQLRNLHMSLDRTVASAYGFEIDLEHGFRQIRQGIRFTISPQAQNKVLDLLLALNHERYAAEQKQAPATKRKSKRSKSEALLLAQMEL